jgi:hypothetical protein
MLRLLAWLRRRTRPTEPPPCPPGTGYPARTGAFTDPLALNAEATAWYSTVPLLTIAGQHRVRACGRDWSA